MCPLLFTYSTVFQRQHTKFRVKYSSKIVFFKIYLPQIFFAQQDCIKLTKSAKSICHKIFIFQINVSIHLRILKNKMYLSVKDWKSIKNIVQHDCFQFFFFNQCLFNQKTKSWFSCHMNDCFAICWIIQVIYQGPWNLDHSGRVHL